MKIGNKLSFCAAVLAFFGTIIIVMDKFGPIHHIINQFPKWQNISIAVADLDTFDTKTRDGSEIGMVERDKPGFVELVRIISINRPDLRNKIIISIVKNQPIRVGGIPMKIVHVGFENNPNDEPLTIDYIFNEWIRDYRDKYFLKIGISVIAVAFLLNVFAHIKWKTREIA